MINGGKYPAADHLLDGTPVEGSRSYSAPSAAIVM